jgi:hypothetical protein
MSIRKNKLYLLLTITCLAGYIWLISNLLILSTENTEGFSVCLIKHATNIPCPSCGATRAILALLKGEFLESLYWNPMGVILFSILLISPLWIGYDLLFRKETLLTYYHKTEQTLQQKWVAIPAIILVIGNWIWNIYKGL